MDDPLDKSAAPHRQAPRRRAPTRGLIGLLAALLCLPLLAAPESPIRVGLFEMPPYYSRDSEGRPVGELIDTLNLVMAQLGYQWQPQFLTVPELLTAVVDGDIDLLMLVQHPMIEHRALYARKPMASMAMLAFHDNTQSRVTSLPALRGKRVAIIHGYGYGGLLNQLLAPDNGLAISVVDDHRQGFQQLADGKVDYLLGYRKPGQRALEQLQLGGIQGDLLNEKPVYFVVSKQAQQQRQLLSNLEWISAKLAIP